MAVTASPYIPSFLRAALTDNRTIQLTFSEISDTNIKSTSSFIYDPLNTPLKNTQQLNVDWSRFENHTFFSSAEVKVNTAFDSIINGYPFDGTKAEIEAFFENMTGFDKYVYDRFPKNRGYLQFSGSWIEVKDAPGALYPDVSKNVTANPIIFPDENTSLTIECQLFLPTAQNATQIICQKISGSTEGFSLHVLSSSLTSSAQIEFVVVSGSSDMSVSTTVDKNKFNHVCVTLNRDEGQPKLQLFLNEELAAISRKKQTFGAWNSNSSFFTIGSGSIVNLLDRVITPQETLSGSIDELRLFHSIRTIKQQQLFAKKSIFASPELKLYFKFNEPTENIGQNVSDSINSIVLDSSGNSLHSLITNFTSSLRVNAASASLVPLVYEKSELNPILFPAHADIVDLNTDLLQSASIYDQSNPNLITKLIPQHFLLAGAQEDGFAEVEGLIGDSYPSTGFPGQNRLAGVQVLLSFLYLWAKFFDEIKLFVQAFGDVQWVDYDLNDTTPASFLTSFAKEYGFNLPPLFNDSTIEQYVNAENIEPEISTNILSLKKVQEQILRRTLVSLPNIIRSKGTQHSIKSFLRSIGIDPDNSLRIREYGGPTTKTLEFSREYKREQNLMLFLPTGSLITSTFLSSSRVEPGYPEIIGTFVNGVSNNRSDGLLTSGSWTIEGTYKFLPSLQAVAQKPEQSLFRLCSTSSLGVNILANLVATSGSGDGYLTAYLRAGDDTTAPLLALQLDLPNNDIFDANHWHITFGCSRADAVDSIVSSSYFLRASSAENGTLFKFFSTSSFFYEQNSGISQNALRTITTNGNSSGSFIEIGDGRTYTSSSSDLFLNNTLIAPDEARETYFTGKVSNFRFWSKDLNEEETKEHTRNYKSLGVSDPKKNYNFVDNVDNSFEHVRMDVISRQPVREADTNGEIILLDFSLNQNHMFGSGFVAEDEVLSGDLFEYSYFSPSFDEASTDEKIRVRSFLDQDLVDNTPWAQTAPISEIPKNELPFDDPRFSIEFSLVDALNRDIVTMFSTFQSLDDALGAPELQFSIDYPDLEIMRNIYFNRLSSKLNFRDFFDFYRWFDMSIGTFIEQLVPRKTKFKGTNFTIESHMLERAKIQYFTQEQYVEENTRAKIKDSLLLQQINGVIRKY